MKDDETKREVSELAVEFVETPAYSTWHPVALEAQILACLESRPEPHETVDLAFRRKERDLMALFDQLSDKDDPSELLAVAAMKPDTTDRIPTDAAMLVIVIDRPASPGNLGTLIRSADAFGATSVIVTGHGVDLYDPATIRASVGTFFSMPAIALPSHREVADWIATVRPSHPSLAIVGTSARATTSLRDFAWPRDIVLAVGNETSGLSHAYRDLSDAMVTIPMLGAATSLNAAVATSIVLYEVASARATTSRANAVQ